MTKDSKKRFSQEYKTNQEDFANYLKDTENKQSESLDYLNYLTGKYEPSNPFANIGYKKPKISKEIKIDDIEMINQLQKMIDEIESIENGAKRIKTNDPKILQKIHNEIDKIESGPKPISITAQTKEFLRNSIYILKKQII